jgi:hypothetical protein
VLTERNHGRRPRRWRSIGKGLPAAIGARRASCVARCGDRRIVDPGPGGRRRSCPIPELGLVHDHLFGAFGFDHIDLPDHDLAHHDALAHVHQHDLTSGDGHIAPDDVDEQRSSRLCTGVNRPGFPFRARSCELERESERGGGGRR